MYKAIGRSDVGDLALCCGSFRDARDGMRERRAEAINNKIHTATVNDEGVLNHEYASRLAAGTGRNPTTPSRRGCTQLSKPDSKPLGGFPRHPTRLVAINVKVGSALFSYSLQAYLRRMSDADECVAKLSRSQHPIQLTPMQCSVLIPTSPVWRAKPRSHAVSSGILPRRSSCLWPVTGQIRTSAGR